MKVFMTAAAVLLSGMLVLCLGAQKVDARKPYHDAFVATYDTTADAAKKAKCGVCHDGPPPQKKWNVYGAALGTALGKKNATPDEVKAAFDKAAAEKSAVDGKTFGDLIKAGKLPAEK